MRKVIYTLKVIILFFVIISQNSCIGNKFSIKKGSENIVSPNGIEYILFAYEGKIDTFGERKFLGKIKWELPKLHHMGGSWDTGMYSCDDSNLDIIYRIKPDSEWGTYYRKATLPKIDLSSENCIRFEFISYKEIKHYENNISPEKTHMSCNDGIMNLKEIESFLIDLKKQKSPKEAGLYDLITKENGMLENCYQLGYVYGYFQNETNLAIPYTVWSFNDIAYSIHTDFGEYVLPINWLEKLGYKIMQNE